VDLLGGLDLAKSRFFESLPVARKKSTVAYYMLEQLCSVACLHIFAIKSMLRSV